MIKVFERTAIDNSVSGKDVVVAGKVSNITEKKVSKAGGYYLTISIRGSNYDPDIDLEVEDELTVLFVDKESTKYGKSPDASNAEKLKIKVGATVAIRATEIRTVDPETGNENITYFGSRVQYVGGGCKFHYKFSKKGKDADVVVGTAVVHENTEGRSLTVPIRFYDAAAENPEERQYTVWLQVEQPSNEMLDDLEPVDGKNPPVAFIFDKLKEETDEKTKRVKSLKGVCVSYAKVC